MCAGKYLKHAVGVTQEEHPSAATAAGGYLFPAALKLIARDA